MNANQVTAASTAELVAFYNANAAKPVTKFSDRKTAERRVLALIAEIEQKMAAVRPKAAAAKYVPGTCPNCGGEHGNITCGTVIERHGKQEVVREHEALCHGCGHEFNYNTGKPLKKVAASADRAAAIAATWTDSTVRAARVARHAVSVKGVGSFGSVSKAFAALNLPSNKIIRTRALLVAGGAATVDKYEFTLQAK